MGHTHLPDAFGSIEGDLEHIYTSVSRTAEVFTVDLGRFTGRIGNSHIENLSADGSCGFEGAFDGISCLHSRF